MERKFPQTDPTYHPSSFFTPMSEAISEIKERRKDTKLMKRVTEYLNGDVPTYFDRKEPVLYLSRHIATPNYETLKFIEMGRPYELPLVIGQDAGGKFVSHNELKKALGKLPVTKGYSRNQDEIVENFTVVDFREAQGKSFVELKTKNGKDFIQFHNSLFQHIYPNDVEIADEKEWLDRNHRDNLIEQYKKILAITTVHAVLFESFTDKDQDIVDSIIGPAFDEISKIIGCRPIIVEHISPELELTRDWNGYPSILYQFIKTSLQDDNC